jgi:DNA end-binding protein Ku
MARSMWRGAIQFGLVTIPVKLYLATESSSIGFNMLHETCLNRIQMKVYCPFHDEVVPRSETVKGYEWSKGKYVVVTEEDLESVPLKTVRSIEIEAFVDEEEAEEKGSRFVKQAYYLEPDEVGRKAFYLLQSVLAETGKTAICKIVLRDREQLAALNPYANTLLLNTLHWPDEVRSLDELNLPAAGVEIKPAERKMAEQLISSMAGEFDPDAYHDEYRDALMGVIEAKVSGQKPEPAARTEPTRIGDLMAALEASVAAARDARRSGAGAADAADAAEDATGTSKRRRPSKAAEKPAKAKAKAKAPARRKKAEEPEEAPTRRRKTA